MSEPADLPIRLFEDAAVFGEWLEANRATSGLWLKIAKKGSGMASITYAEALDVALCHGWIDGQKKGLDEKSFLQRFTPRKKRSLWSKINVGHVERLAAADRMREGGLREVEAAKADGRWDAAYHGAAKMEVPPELATALAKNKKAQAFFDALDKTNRYAFCFRVHNALKPETKAARVEKSVAMLARDEKIH